MEDPAAVTIEATTTAINDDRWAFLGPWCAPLDGHLVLIHQNRGLGVMIYAWELVGTDVHKLMAVRDALVLLAKVLRVNCCAFKHLLRTYCGLSHRKNVAVLEAKWPEKLVVELNMTSPTSESTGVEDVLLGLFPEFETISRAESFEIAVQEIYKCAGTSRPAESEKLLIGLSISATSLTSTHHFPVWWRVMKALRLRHGGWEFPGSTSSDSIVLGPVSIAVVGVVTEEIALAVEEIATTGKGLTVIYFNLSPEMSRQFSAGEMRLIRRAIRSLLCGGADTVNNGAVIESVIMSQCIYRSALVSRLSSAFANTRCARSVSLILEQLASTPEERRRMWQCIAFAFFSRYARTHSTMKSLKLEGLALDTVDANAVAAVLTSQDPSNMLFSRAANATRARSEGGNTHSTTTAMVKRGIRVRFAPVEPDDRMLKKSASWTLASDVHDVVVLQDGDEESDYASRVLIPGYGACEVQSDQVIPTSSQIVDGGVSSLHLDFDRDDGSTSGLPVFMGLIGLSLTTLSLKVPSSVPTWMPDIMRSCPNLKKLTIRGDAIDTSAILRVYRESTMPLEELSCYFNDIVVFYEELSDTQSRLAKAIKRIGCYFDNTHQVWQCTGRLDCVAKMLHTNRTLERMQLMVPATIRDDIEAELKQFDDDPLPVVLEPFPLASRLALLSLFEPSRGGNDEEGKKQAKAETGVAKHPASSVLAGLPVDRLGLSTIFSFAATSVRRQVRLTPVKLVPW